MSGKPRQMSTGIRSGRSGRDRSAMLMTPDNQPHARFIDFAHHGGCSQKLSSMRLRDLLKPLVSTWSDAGVTEVGGELTASSVDIVLPMIDDSALFGRIVTNHVLS